MAAALAQPEDAAEPGDHIRAGAGAPLLRATAHGYRIWVQWRTELGGDGVCARWLFVLASGDIPSR